MREEEEEEEEDGANADDDDDGIGGGGGGGGGVALLPVCGDRERDTEASQLTMLIFPIIGDTESRTFSSFSLFLFFNSTDRYEAVLFDIVSVSENEEFVFGAIRLSRKRKSFSLSLLFSFSFPFSLSVWGYLNRSGGVPGDDTILGGDLMLSQKPFLRGELEDNGFEFTELDRTGDLERNSLWGDNPF